MDAARDAAKRQGRQALIQNQHARIAVIADLEIGPDRGAAMAHPRSRQILMAEVFFEKLRGGRFHVPGHDFRMNGNQPLARQFVNPAQRQKRNGLLLFPRILRRHADPVKLPVALILEQARGELGAVVAGPFSRRLHPEGVTEFCHLQKRIAVILCQGVGQMRDAGRGHDRKPRPPMDFIVKNLAKFVIQHYFQLLWACSWRGQCGAIAMRGIDAGCIPASFAEAEFNVRRV